MWVQRNYENTNRFRSLNLGLVPIVALTLLVGLVAVGCSSNDSKSKSSTTSTQSGSANGQQAIAIQTFAFDPSPVTIKVGTNVTWTNNDRILHTVTSGVRDNADGKYESNLNDIGSTYSRVFNEKGTFNYFCEIHPNMDAEIIVE